MMLEVNAVSSGYGDLTVLRDITFTLDDGEFVGVVGANAAGKTTLARVLAGLLPVSKGEIRWDGQSLNAMPAHRRPGAGLMMVPEGRALFPFMTVRENLEIGATNPRGQAHISRNLERVMDFFPILRQKADAPARSLSGGQQQMLAIGRALMGMPRLLILDEPSVGLAPVVVQEIYDLLHTALRKETAVLLIEQDVRRCLKAAERAIVMANGQLILSGAADEIKDSDEVRRAYLGL